jgi:membrane protein
MLERDVIFIDLQMYIPLIIGILLAIVQFVPEIQQSRLKLTLHLPYPHYRIIAVMLLYGILVLLVCFVFNFIFMSVYFIGILAGELVKHILMTALTWYIAGFTGYLLTAWICLEPTWKRRILNIVIAVCVLRVFFLSAVPEAYNSFLPVLIGYTSLTVLLSMLSVYRFKTGQQD